MFKRLYNTFYYEAFFYILDVPKETVIERLDFLLTERSGLFKSPNLKGRFVDYPDTFFLTQKWWLGHIRGLEREPAILKGVITKLSDKQTKIEISVRPNSVFWVFAVFFLPYGLYLLYKAIRTNDLNSTLGGLWLTFFVLPILYFIVRTVTSRLRKAFENYMNMRPVNENELSLTAVATMRADEHGPSS